jgi:hypothetical protein
VRKGYREEDGRKGRERKRGRGEKGREGKVRNGL